MDLNQLKMRTGLDAWVNFKGVGLQLSYMDKPALAAMVDQAKVRSWNRKHQPTEKVDGEKLVRGLARLIKDWKLTLGQLARLMPVDIGDQDPQTAVPFTIDNAVLLVGEVYGLDDFILETITDLQQFEEKKLAADVSD